MTVYYIKITEEEPPSTDETVWFKLDSDSDELYVLDRNKFDQITLQWQQAVNNLETSEILTSAVNNLIGELTSNSSTLTVGNSTNATYVQDTVDPTRKHDYSSIEQIRTNVESLSSNKLNSSDYIVDSELKNLSQNPVQNKVVKSAIDSLTSSVNGSLTSLRNSITNLQNSLNTHKHTGWKNKVLNSYSEIYYNDSIRMAVFRYYRTNYNFKNTSPITLHSGLIPKDYRPTVDAVLPFYHYHLVGYIEKDNGNMVIQTDKVSYYNINTSITWKY